jgi:hypothetical protein
MSTATININHTSSNSSSNSKKMDVEKKLGMSLEDVIASSGAGIRRGGNDGNRRENRDRTRGGPIRGSNGNRARRDAINSPYDETSKPARKSVNDGSELSIKFLVSNEVAGLIIGVSGVALFVCVHNQW